MDSGQTSFSSNGVSSLVSENREGYYTDSFLLIRVVADNDPDHLKIIQCDNPGGEPLYVANIRQSYQKIDRANLSNSFFLFRTDRLQQLGYSTNRSFG